LPTTTENGRFIEPHTVFITLEVKFSI